MFTPENIKYILIDFDGVIAKNSLEITLSYAHDFINRFTPYHIDSLKNYYIAINSFDLKEALTLLFRSLGIEEHLPDFAHSLKELKEYKHQTITIEGDYLGFISFCKSKNIGYSIFSLADRRKIENLLGFKPNYIKFTPGLVTKANPRTYNFICNELKLNPPEILAIDDDPFVLRSAKLAGMHTALMKNEFYNKHTTQYQRFTDIEINSFSDLKKKLTFNPLSNIL